MKSAIAAAALCCCLPCVAQAQMPPERAADSVPQRGGEPVVQRIVNEDESVRIEELRVRGQTRRIVVRSKLPGVPAYEVGTAADGRDVTQDRRSEGRSLWQVFAF